MVTTLVVVEGPRSRDCTSALGHAQGSGLLQLEANPPGDGCNGLDGSNTSCFRGPGSKDCISAPAGLAFGESEAWMWLAPPVGLVGFDFGRIGAAGEELALMETLG